MLAAMSSGLIAIALWLRESSDLNKGDFQVEVTLSDRGLSASRSPETSNGRRSNDIDSAREVRLEEIYRHYPNLRPEPFVAPNRPTIYQEITKLLPDFEALDRKERSKLYQMCLGKVDWDSEAVTEFLDHNAPLIVKLQEVSSCSLLDIDEYMMVEHECPEAMAIAEATKLLNLKLQYHVRESEEDEARAVLEILKPLSRTEGRSQTHTMVGSLVENRVLESLTRLSREGFDVIGFLDEWPDVDSRPAIRRGLLGDFASTIFYPESIRESMMFQDVTEDLVKNGYNKDLSIETVEDLLALHVSAQLGSLIDSSWQGNEDGDTKDKLIGGNEGELSARELQILNSLSKWNSTSALRRNFAELETLRLKLRISNAQNEAAGNGRRHREISDLVPEYLSEIPVDSWTGEPLELWPDMTESGVKAPSKKRGTKKRRR